VFKKMTPQKNAVYVSIYVRLVPYVHSQQGYSPIIRSYRMSESGRGTPETKAEP